MEAPNETPVDTATPDAPAPDTAAPTVTPTPDIPQSNLVEISSLPEDVRDHSSLKKFVTGNEGTHMNVDNLAKSFVNVQGMLGRDNIPIPQTEADWDNAYTKLGRPETADGYELPPVQEDFDANVKTVAEQKGNWWKGVAHKYGLNPQQAAGIYSEFLADQNTDVSNINAANQTNLQAAEQSMRDKYGSAYNKVYAMTDRFIQERGGDQLFDALSRTGANKDPVILEFLMDLSRDHAEDLGLSDLGEPLYTPESLQEQINEKMSDPAYLNKDDPRHALIVQQVQKLHQQLHSI